MPAPQRASPRQPVPALSFLNQACCRPMLLRAHIAVWLKSTSRASGLRARRNCLRLQPPSTGIHATGRHRRAREVGEEVSIGPCAVIGEVASIGEGTRIEAGAVIGAGVASASTAAFIPAGHDLPRNHARQSGRGPRRRGAGRGRLRLRARPRHRRLHAVSAAGNPGDRRRRGDRRQLHHRPRRAGTRPASAAAPRSTTWSTWATTATSAKT